jgi:hypothetical protein
MITAIAYTVGAIPLTIARQIMVALTAAQILAKLTPTDNETCAAIEVALFDRPELDRLLEPFEATLKRQASGQ